LAVEPVGMPAPVVAADQPGAGHAVPRSRGEVLADARVVLRCR
jgi:hypothetical protein